MRKNKVNKIGLVFLLLVSLVVFAGCRQSDKVSYNVSQEADNFNVNRRVAVINTRTDKIEFEVVGRISVDSGDSKKLVILVETAKGVYKKHIINMTNNNMYVLEDLEGAEVNEYKYEVNYMPESIVPFTSTNKN